MSEAELKGQLTAIEVDSAAELPATTPEQASAPYVQFAAHVEYVRDNGDMMDAAAQLERLSSLKGELLIAAIGSHVLSTYGLSGMGSMLEGAGAVGVFTAGYNLRRQHKLRGRIKEAQQPAIAEKLSEHYELWNVPNDQTGQPEVVLHWQGTSVAETDDKTLQARTVPDSLQLIATLAERSDIKAVLVSPETVAQVRRPEAFARSRVDLAEWVKHKKDLALPIRDRRRRAHESEAVNHELLVFTPDDLRLLANNLATEVKPAPQLRAYIAALREKNAEHPLVRAYDSQTPGGEQQIATMQKIARDCLERRLDDVTAVRGFDVAGQPLKTKVHIHGKLQNDRTVYWHNGGRHFDTQSLAAALDLTLAQAQEIVETPDLHPTTAVVQAVELLIASYRLSPEEERAVTYLSAPTIDRDIQFATATALVRNRRMRIVHAANIDHTIGSSGLRKVLLGSSAFALVGMVSLSGLADTNIEASYSHAALADKQQMADQLGANVSKLTDAQIARAKQTTDAAYPLYAAYVDLRTKEQAAVSAVSSTLADRLSGISSSGGAKGLPYYETGFGAIGNVANPNDARPVWHIKNPSGHTLEGYWTTDVGESLTNYGLWFTDLTARDVHTDALPSRPAHPETAIEVTGLMKPMYGPSTANLPSVPVLQGTIVVAANYGGRPVLVRRHSNGAEDYFSPTYKADPTSRTFRYWLEPATDPYAGPIAHALPPLRGSYRRLQPDVQAAWGKVIPNIDQLSDTERAAAEVSYIKWTFVYDYNPLSDDMTRKMAYGQLSNADFINTQLQAGKANCNVAATLVAMDNPELAVAWGFNNDNSTTLDGGEAHMWLVDAAGNRYDPTPSLRVVPFKPANYADLALQRDLTPRNLLLGGLGLMVLGGAAANRRRLQRRMSGSALDGLSSEELQQGLQVINTALYAPAFRLPALPSLVANRADVISQLASPQFHEKSTRHTLAVLAHEHSGAEKAALQAARRILRHVARTQRLVSPLAVNDVHTVL